jgi:DNA sulfur modification protein DndB
MTVVAYPAIQGKIGDWTYYVTTMSMLELVQRVSFAEDLYPPSILSLSEIIQRDLTERGEQISDYLIREKQHFFGSMIIAVADGHPKFTPVKIIDPSVLYQRIDDLGLLTFDGSQKYFALDGQHRLRGIQIAIKKRPSLAEEQISVIFVKHQHTKKTNDGIARTRRLFTTLNRYAKAISLKDAIVMDEDDPIAVTTRELVRQYPLFQGERLALKKRRDGLFMPATGLSISPDNRKAFTNLTTLYKANESIVGYGRQIPKTFKRVPQSLAELDKIYLEVTNFWEKLIAAIPSIKKIKDDPDSLIADAQRSRLGGNLLFRPVGLLTLAKTYKNSHSVIDENVFFRRIAKINFDLGVEPWVGVLWHPGNKRMISDKANSKLALELLSYMIGLKMDKKVLSKNYNKMLSNLGAKRKRLPRKVN